MKKGSKMSEEQRQKVSEAVKKALSKPEVLKKLSESHKGQHSSPKTEFKKGLVPWNKGKKGIYSEEVLMKNRLAHEGKHPSAEIRKKLSESRKGRIFSEETRRKIGDAHKGKKHTSESLLKMSEAKSGKMFGEQNPFYGKSHSEETKKKISEAKKIMYSKGKIVHPMKGKKTGKPSWNKGKTGALRHTQEAKLKIRESRAKQIFPVKDSLPEIMIQKFLKQLNIEFIPHKYIKDIEHAYQCDIFIPSVNLIIEVDGDYWHGNTNNPRFKILNEHQIKAKEKDNIRTKELLEKGFKVLRLWESDINKDVAECLKKIEEVLAEKKKI